MQPAFYSYVLAVGRQSEDNKKGRCSMPTHMKSKLLVATCSLVAMLVYAPQLVGSNPGLAGILADSWSSRAGSHSSLSAQSGDGLGYSAGIDGNTVVLGAPYPIGGIGTGAVYVYIKTGNQWTDLQPVAKLTPSDNQNGEEFGISVALSGNTIVVGAYLDTVGGNLAQGAAYVFVMPAGGWHDMTETAKLTASGGQPYDVLGFSVALGGNNVFVGAPGVTDDRGAVYVFTEPADGWQNMTQTAKLTSSDAQMYDNFGSSVAISANTLAVGSPYANNNGSDAGAVYVYTQSGPVWRNGTQNAKLVASDPVNLAKLGYSVAIQNNTIVAGEYAGTYPGTYVFVKSGSIWENSQQTAKLTATGNPEYMGYSVAISGNIILAGAPGTNINGQEDEGAAFVFAEPAGGWTNMTQTAELTVADGSADDRVGEAVALQGNTAIVGDPGPTLVGEGLVFINGGFSWRNMTPTVILSE